MVKDLARRGSSVIYYTHYLGEVEDLQARIVILDRGQVIADGSISELTSHNGGAYIELTLGEKVRRVSTTNPGKDMAGILNSLGADAALLQNVEVIQSSLETVFLELTGRRFEPEGGVDVVAS